MFLAAKKNEASAYEKTNEKKDHNLLIDYRFQDYVGILGFSVLYK